MLNLGKEVRGQLIPLQGMNLVLPNTCIAEVIAYCQPQAVDDSPDWLLGMLDWRGLKIPLISFSRLAGQITSETDSITRVAVLNGITENNDLPFYGIAIQGIPRLASYNSTNINTITQPAAVVPLALEHTMIGNLPAIIPDLEQIEATLVREHITVLIPEQSSA